MERPWRWPEGRGAIFAIREVRGTTQRELGSELRVRRSCLPDPRSGSHSGCLAARAWCLGGHRVAGPARERAARPRALRASPRRAGRVTGAQPAPAAAQCPPRYVRRNWGPTALAGVPSELPLAYLHDHTARRPTSGRASKRHVFRRFEGGSWPTAWRQAGQRLDAGKDDLPTSAAPRQPSLAADGMACRRSLPATANLRPMVSLAKTPKKPSDRPM